MEAKFRGDFVVGERDPLTPEKLSALVSGIAQRIVSQCGPGDSLLVSMLVTKIVGELVRMNCANDKAAEQMLRIAADHVSNVQVETYAERTEGDDDGGDPFSVSGFETKDN